MRTLNTVEARHIVEIPKIKGSRFIGILAPAESESGAEAVVAAVREEHPGATHWVWAWRIDPEHTRSTDDGEPAGTAGRPLFDRLVGHDLERVVLVVVRYYGGTKLGTGGLVRAYGAAASAVIEAAPIASIERRVAVRAVVSMKLEGPVRGVAAQHDATVVDVGWTHEVTMDFAVPEDGVDAFVADVQERCAGSAQIEIDVG